MSKKYFHVAAEFIDKDDSHISKGQVIETEDDERVEELRGAGVLGKEATKAQYEEVKKAEEKNVDDPE